jgi:hypothetical protein
MQLSQSQAAAAAESQQLYNTADVVFASLFTVELLLNMAAHLFLPFFRDVWNWFDMVRDCGCDAARPRLLRMEA